MTITAQASYLGLCVVQGALVLAPRVPRSRLLVRLHRCWPVVLGVPGAATLATYFPSVAAGVAGSVATIALVLVPPLAVLGAGWLQRRPDARLVAIVPPLLALALLFPGSWIGSLAALVIVALAAVALAALAVVVIPRRAVVVGLFLWASVDLATSLTHALERSSSAIVGATPAVAPHVELQLQSVQLGGASMEFADLFVAATLGALLAGRARDRAVAAVLVAGIGMAMSVLFLVTDVIAGTVPVAIALAVDLLRGRRRGRAEVGRARALPYVPTTTSTAVAAKSRAR